MTSSRFQFYLHETILKQNQALIFDRGYRDEKCISTDQLSGTSARIAFKSRARHEIINGRLKKWNVLSSKFRHRLVHHGQCFHAIRQIVELELEMDPIFAIHI